LINNIQYNLSPDRNNLIDIEMNPYQKYVANSKLIPTIPGRKYVVSTTVVGIKGFALSAYFGIDIINHKNIDSDRRIVWLDDFSGNKKNIDISFTAMTASIRAVYRINYETRRRSKCKYLLLPLDHITFKEIPPSHSESFSEPKNYFLPRVKELSNSDELILEKNLVWIFASSRSGTTWLGTELLTHQTHIMSEPKLDLHLGPLSYMNEEMPTEYELNQNRPTYIFSTIYSNTWKFYLRKLILNRINSQFKDLSKKIIIKDPSGSTFGFNIIASCFPNSKIIWLVRDGRDVIDSQLDARIYGYSKGGRFEKDKDKKILENERYDFIKKRARLWKDMMKRMKTMLDNHSPDLRLIVYYEKLRNSTIEELQKIYQFLDIKISKDELEKIVSNYSFENIPSEKKGKGKLTRSAKHGGWKNNFRDKEKDLMEKLLGNTLKKLGYD